MSEQPVIEQSATEPPATEQSAPEQPVPGQPAEQPAGAAPHPAEVWAVPAHLVPPVRPKRTWLRTALRWTIAAVVCAAVAVGTLVAVSLPRRTDIPGLKTPADTRYTFPRLKLPALPPKALTPAQGRKADGNPDHAADLRKLVLPAPLGAKPVKGFLPDSTGWYPVASYIKAMGGGTRLGAEFSEVGMRHIAARAWTGPDGVRTEIYLLQFRSDLDTSNAYLADLDGSTRPTIGKDLRSDVTKELPGLLTSTDFTTLSQRAGSGEQAVRMGLVDVGEVEAVIVMSDPKAVPLVNFRQVVTLQGELLQG